MSLNIESPPPTPYSSSSSSSSLLISPYSSSSLLLSLLISPYLSLSLLSSLLSISPYSSSSSSSSLSLSSSSPLVGVSISSTSGVCLQETTCSTPGIFITNSLRVGAAGNTNKYTLIPFLTQPPHERTLTTGQGSSRVYPKRRGSRVWPGRGRARSRLVV